MQQQLTTPLLSAVNSTQVDASILRDAIGSAETFLRLHSSSSMADVLTALRGKAADKARKWTNKKQPADPQMPSTEAEQEVVGSQFFSRPQQQELDPSSVELNTLPAEIKAHNASCEASGIWTPMTPRQPDYLLPKLALTAVAKSQPSFAHLAVILSGATDKQNVACAEAVFCNTDYIAAVNLAGFPETALVLTILGRAFQAFDVRGLSLEDRAERLFEQALLISQVSTLGYCTQ